MTTRLTEVFFKDLEDLEDDEENMNIEPDKEKLLENNKNESHQQIINEMMQEFPHKCNEVSAIFHDSQFLDLLKQIDKYSDLKIKEYTKKIDVGDIEYSLVQSCNKYSNIIDREITIVHKLVRDLYYKRFPELESIVINPLDYVKCDLTKIDLSSLLTNHQIVAVNVAGSSNSGSPLSNSELNSLTDACNNILKLDEYKTKILSYVESRMQYIAPNLSAIVGSTIAAQLLAAAGGLDALSRMPACNIQVIGSQKKGNIGFSKANMKMNQGFFGNLEMVKKAPTQFQIKLIRMLSTNCAKAARIDNLQSCSNGSLGEKIKEDMLKRFVKIQEPAPAKKVKPLPIPDDRPRKKRGGKRFRNMKERMALTEVRKYKNRMSFGAEAQKEFRDTGHGFGMLGAGIGKVKLQQKETKINITKKQRAFQEKSRKTTGESGLASSVAFTPVQGMYLANPDMFKAPENKKSEMYFNKESGFKTVLEERKNKNNIFDNILKKN